MRVFVSFYCRLLLTALMLAGGFRNPVRMRRHAGSACRAAAMAHSLQLLSREQPSTYKVLSPLTARTLDAGFMSIAVFAVILTY